jgi:hypothetical protein
VKRALGSFSEVLGDYREMRVALHEQLDGELRFLGCDLGALLARGEARRPASSPTLATEMPVPRALARNGSEVAGTRVGGNGVVAVDQTAARPLDAARARETRADSSAPSAGTAATDAPGSRRSVGPTAPTAAGSSPLTQAAGPATATATSAAAAAPRRSPGLSADDAASAALFFIDNSRCAVGQQVHLDGVLQGEVPARARAAFRANVGHHEMCLLPIGSHTACGSPGTVRRVYLHDGWSITMRCE